MKTLVEYINENLQQINEAFYLLKNVNAKNAQSAAKVEDSIKNFLIGAKKRYSFNNKHEMELFFNDFVKFAKLDSKLLKEFGIVDAKSLAKLLVDNKEALEKANWNLKAIKSFDESEMKKEYKKWKESKDYVEGKELNKEQYKDANEEQLKRTLVVYYVNDPGNDETTIEYEDFEGKVGKDTSHQINMLKMDWCDKTGLKYYDARPILLSNYLKKSDEELAKREITFDDSDLEEI